MNRITQYGRVDVDEVQVGPVSVTERGGDGPNAYCYNLKGVEYWICTSSTTFPLTGNFSLARLEEPDPAPSNEAEVTTWLQSMLPGGVLQLARQQAALLESAWRAGTAGSTFKLEFGGTTVGYWTRRVVGSDLQEAAIMADTYAFPFSASLEVSIVTPNPIPLAGDPESALKVLFPAGKNYSAIQLSPVPKAAPTTNRLAKKPEKLGDVLG